MSLSAGYMLGEGAVRIPAFDIVTGRDEGETVVELVGELDAATAVRVRKVLLELAGEDGRRVTVDLSQLTFIDSTGLNVLVGGLKRLRSCGGDLILRSPRPSAMKVFEIVGLDKVFTFADGPSRAGSSSSAG